MAYLFLKTDMIEWHDSARFDMLLFDKFVQMLSVVDFIMFCTNISVIYNINKYTIFEYRVLRL